MRSLTASIVAAVLFSAGLACVAKGQVGLPWPGPGTAHSAGGGGYTGPGDIKTFTAWAGFRAYSAATRGTKFANVCNGGVCADLNTDATTGQAPNAPTVNGAACNNSTHICTVKTLYDQTGNLNDFSQGTAADQPAYNVSAVGSLPCAKFASASSNVMSMATTPTIAQPFTLSGVFDRTGNTTLQNYVLSNGGFFFYHESSVNVFDIYAGGSVISLAANDNAFHAAQGVYNGASSALYVDGTSNTGSAGTAGFNNVAFDSLGGSNGTAHYDGFICEIGIASAAWNSTDAGSVNTNQHTFWGF